MFLRYFGLISSLSGRCYTLLDSSVAGPDSVLSPWQLPLVNTLILVTSSITLTVAHEALKLGERKTCRNWLAGTVLLGCCFIMIQGVEYYEAYTTIMVLRLRQGSSALLSLF